MSTFTKRIDSNIRDIDHQKDGSTWYFDQDVAYNLGNPGAVTRNIGLRFTGITIPQGATISSAKITFTARNTLYQSYPQNINLKIQGIAEDNTAEFVASPEDSARTRTKTTASVTWSGNVSESAGVPFDTPSITTIIQEIVDRAGWSSGNALALFISDNGSASGKYLEVLEYNDDTTKAALLTIEYTAGSPSSSVSPSLSPSASISPSSTPSPSISPSASVSPSASISPSSSASASPSPASYGIKIKKQEVNKNVQDITDPKELAFTSALGVLGQMLDTTVNATTDANGDISVTSTHNIGYPVITKVEFDTFSTSSPNSITYAKRILLPIEYHTLYQNALHELIEVTETASYKFDSNNLVITLHAEYYNHDTAASGNIASRPYTFRVYYYFNEVVENA